MAKWFRDFPINLRNGTERARSASESGPQTRPKPGITREILKGTQRKDGTGGVGSLLSGRTRKNSAFELGRSGTCNSGTVWDNLIPGKNRKSSKLEAGLPDENRPLRTSSLAHAYISRMIKVDKQEKNVTVNGSDELETPENERGRTEIKTATLIMQNYADPYDAEQTREQREAERAGEDDGYMEPYDAQVIITEVRRRGSKDLLKVCVLLDRGQGEGRSPAPPNIYDTPYEGGLEGDAGGVWIPVTRPESDARPTGEYELPWEWRKEDIVRALSAQFEGVDCSHSKDDCGHPGHPPLQHPKHKSWNNKTLIPASLSPATPFFPSSPILKLSPLSSPPPSFPTLKLSPPSPSSPSTTKLSPPCPPSPCPSSPCPGLDQEGVRVERSLPLERQSWYHGNVSRQQAESQLQRCREASFLVRDSESGTSKYSIALKTSQGCVHIIVAQTRSMKGQSFTLDQSSCVFSSIPELVHHYHTHSLPFTGAQHMTLQNPVPRPH